MTEGDSGRLSGQRESHLFLLRIWSDSQPESPTATQWQGKLQPVLGGNGRAFLGWSALIELLEEMLLQRNTRSDDHNDHGPEGAR